MMCRLLILVATPVVYLLPSVTLAVPLQLAHQGRLLDAEQAPLDGEYELTFRLYDAAEDGALLWEDTVTESFTGGYYSAVLGADDDNPLDDGIFAAPPVYLELTVDDGEPLLPRHPIHSVPFALRAGTAENVEGGYVDATDVSIDGNLVIDEDGNWVGPTPAVGWEDLTGVPPSLDTLGGLSCGDGGVAKYELASGLWTCGTDLVLSDAQVLDIVGGSVLDLGIGSTVDGGVIATLDDLDWSMLTGVPDGLADEEDADTLADLGLICADGDRAAWDSSGGEWVCVSEVVGLARIGTSGAAEGQVLTIEGGSASWEDVAASAEGCALTGLEPLVNAALIDCAGVPVRLKTRLGFTAVRVGISFACGLLEDGSIDCWGADSGGQLDPPTGAFSTLDLGWSHGCAIDAAGSVVCWGQDYSGQASPPSGVFTAIAAGGAHTCAIADTSAVHCWGSNTDGQATAPGGAFSSITAGESHTCGIRTDGSVECWGDGPAATPSVSTAILLDASNDSTCALSAGGAITCWGELNCCFPAPAGVFTDLAAGRDSACAISAADNTVVCWGFDQLGEASPPQGVAFSSIDADSNWTTSPAFTCGVVAATGTVACWGATDYGVTLPP